ncbi:MAG: Uma2 family endonuclease, partial [Planctomycetes bacterium]|nr:Uma2 family endonuclease [Planctomycetota bacterium]
NRNSQVAPLTVEQYHGMITSGVIQEGSPVELIDGMLFYRDRRDESGKITTHGPKHSRTLNKLLQLLMKSVTGKSAHVQIQGPFIAGATSEPEPDICLVRGTPDDYTESVPTAADVLLVIEIADSSLRFDQETKLCLYASAGIGLYAIVNLKEKCVELYENPNTEQQKFDQQRVLGTDDILELSLGDIGRLQIPVCDLI